VTGYRLDEGGCIDRSQCLRFTFDGRSYEGYAGDTLASALLANGVNLFARSFKYHRPRGLFTAGPEEPNALLTINSGSRTEPNTRATMVALYDGLIAQSQHCWPSLSFDFLAINNLMGAFLSAGFYYKTFMGPGKKAWMFYEPFIRRAAGLGAATSRADPDRYDRLNTFTDVLVIGSGPTGLMAAHAAAETGQRVIIAEERASLCASLLGDTGMIDGKPALTWRQEAVGKLLGHPNVRVLSGTIVYGYYADNTLGAIEHLSEPVIGHAARQRHHTIHAREVVIATGAIERPIVFDHNDLPGIMLASGVSTYIKQYAVTPAPTIALFTTHDGAYSLVRDAVNAGVEVAAVIDPRNKIGKSARQIIDETGVELLLERVVTRGRGRRSLKGIEIASINHGHLTRVRRIGINALAVSGGWTPTIHLPSQCGDQPVWNNEISAFVPGQPRGHWRVAGAAAGTYSLSLCLQEGAVAGSAASDSNGSVPLSENIPVVDEGPVCSHPFALESILAVNRNKAFVDLQNDVTASDIKLAHTEGFLCVEHVKRYTTLGMGTDQGKTSNMVGLELIAARQHKSIPETGTTRFRPPYSPITIGAIVGSHRPGDLKPIRRTPMHFWHQTHGGDMVTAGLWMRPRAYLQSGESIEQACTREARNVRENVGMVDISPLGKIDVQGPDAAEFLNRVYINNWLKLEVGMARYGVMLREDGFVLDDGTCCRLAEHQFLMTTTTANAAKVLVHLEFLLNVVWPELRVRVTSITDQWAGMAVAGPKSRALLASILDKFDMSNAAFPFMHFRSAYLKNIPVLVSRLSFSGELAYEVFTGPHHALDVWETVLQAGQSFGIVPYGTEALGVLRIEKGHVSGPELDGRTVAADLGLGRMASRKKSYVGSAMMDREGLVDPKRGKLVGLLSLDGSPVRTGSQVVERDKATVGPALGHVSSSCFSPALDKYIGLALVQGGSEANLHRQLYASYPIKGHHTPVEVVDPCFFDPDGSRMHE